MRVWIKQKMKSHLSALINVVHLFGLQHFDSVFKTDGQSDDDYVDDDDADDVAPLRSPPHVSRLQTTPPLLCWHLSSQLPLFGQICLSAGQQ